MFFRRVYRNKGSSSSNTYSDFDANDFQSQFVDYENVCDRVLESPEIILARKFKQLQSDILLLVLLVKKIGNTVWFMVNQIKLKVIMIGTLKSDQN